MVCSVGKQQNERFVWENPTVGNQTLYINVYADNYTRLIAQAVTNISVKSINGSQK